MVLQFQGAPDWLLQEYLNRKRPEEIASEGLNQALGTYMTLEQQQRQQKMQQQQLASQEAQRKAEQFKTIADYVPEDQIPDLAQKYGINIPPSQTVSPQAFPGQMVPMDAQGNVIGGPQQGPQLLGVAQGMAPPLPGGGQRLPASGMGAPTLVDRWNQTMGSPAASSRPTSKAGLAKYHTQLQTQKLERDLATDPNAPKPPTSIDQILAQRVTSGEMTLDEALKKKAEGAGLTAEATTTAKNTVKLTKEKPKAEASLTNTEREYEKMIQEAVDIKNDPDLGMATGATGLIAARLPSTGAKRVAARLETLKAKTLLNVLTSLKELSNTGASGFGQLSNIEGENLRNSISTLDRTLSTDDFKASLDRFINEMKSRKGVLRRTFDETYGGSTGTGGKSDPLGIR